MIAIGEETDVLFIQSWDDFENGITVYVEADKNAAYAYLYTDQKIVSVVWLYNISETPVVPDWITKINYGNPPRNSSEFISSHLILPKVPPDDLLVVTNVRTLTQSSSVHQIEIGIIAPDKKNIQLLAVLRDDQKCGWCYNALKDNSVAKNLEVALSSSSIIPSSCWKNESEYNNDYYVLKMTT